MTNNELLKALKEIANGHELSGRDCREIALAALSLQQQGGAFEVRIGDERVAFDGVDEWTLPATYSRLVPFTKQLALMAHAAPPQQGAKPDAFAWAIFDEPNDSAPLDITRSEVYAMELQGRGRHIVALARCDAAAPVQVVQPEVVAILKDVQRWIEQTLPIPTNGATAKAIKLQQAIDALCCDAAEPVTRFNEKVAKFLSELKWNPETHPQITEPVKELPECKPMLTECPRCKNDVSKCDGVFANLSAKEAAPELPPLPERAGTMRLKWGKDGDEFDIDGYTAPQMRDYARAAIAAATPQTVQPVTDDDIWKLAVAHGRFHKAESTDDVPTVEFDMDSILGLSRALLSTSALAREKVLEEAAKVCDKVFSQVATYADQSRIANICASRIRALSNQERPAEPRRGCGTCAHQDNAPDGPCQTCFSNPTSITKNRLLNWQPKTTSDSANQERSGE